MSFRVALFSLVSLLSVSLAVAGCAGVETGEQPLEEATPTPGEGDDDDDDGSTPNVTPTPEPTATQPVGGNGTEVETNDDHDTANPLGASTTFSGSCGDLDIADIFELAVPAGKTVSATITWTEGVDEDLDLYVSNYDYTIDEGDESVPPGDSPAQISAAFPTAQDGYVEVFCYYALTPNVSYTGTITVQ
jgi:hypothetical protein